MSKSGELTTGPVWKNLLFLAGPMIFGIVAVISVSLVDTYFVGQLGTKELAALSFTFPVSLTISSLAIGLGAGASSVVSRATGSGDEGDAKRLATDSLVLSTVLVLLISAIGYFTIRPLFSVLGASGEVLDIVERYMQIWYISMPFLVVPMVANAIIRAVGDALWPSTVMVLAALLNMAVTPIFIFGWGPVPALNVEGAAWGTLVARVFTLVFAFWLITRVRRMVIYSLPSWSDLQKSFAKVLKVALPASFGNAVNPIGIAVVTAFLATYGDDVVAGFGTATRLESFAVVPMLALSSAIGPFAGQNWGAGQFNRVSQALKVSYAACFVWAMVLSVVFWLGSDAIVGLFTSDPEVIDTASAYVTIVPLSVWGYGWIIVAAGAFNSIGKSLTGLSLYLTRTALLYVPLSFVASLLAQSWSVFSQLRLQMLQAAWPQRSILCGGSHAVKMNLKAQPSVQTRQRDPSCMLWGNPCQNALCALLIFKGGKKRWARTSSPG
ncbi:MAG: MATE family efflux transporter [Pseudomonadota bacterium]